MNLILLILFFFSGLSSLVFEVSWLKLFSPLFGNSVYATTVVVSTFMAGLAIGGYLGGKLIEKNKTPLLIFSVSQLCIGLYALFLPALTPVIKTAYIHLSVKYDNSLLFLQSLRIFLSFSVMVVPTTLMGLSYPVLGREIARSSFKCAGAIGSLYSVNSFGGAIGSFLTGFFLILTLGINGTNYLAGSINILVAVASIIAWKYSRKIPPHTTTYLRKKIPKNREDLAPLSSKFLYGLLALTFISGFTALGYEMLWLRSLVPLIESTTYTFSIVLSLFLCGLGIGNYIYYRFLKSNPRLLTYAILFEIVVGIYSLFSVNLLAHLFDFGAMLYRMMGSLSWEKIIIAKCILTFTILIIPTTLFGILLPLVSSLFSPSLNKIGRGIGDTFSANMLGSIFGSVATGFILIPTLGVKASFILLGIMNIATGLLLLVFRNPSVTTIIGSIISLLAALLLAPELHKINILKPAPGEEIIYYNEGVAGNVEVSKNHMGYNILRVDNKTHGGNEPWVKKDELRVGHFPFFLHDHPKDILLIGLGTGITLDAIARHAIHSVDCVEIVGDLINTTQYFFNRKPRILEKEEVNIIVEDGRNYMARTKKKYDIIIMDLIHPESSSAASLFTKEYFEDAQKTLRDNGLVAQWLPLHQLSPFEAKIIMRTFASVFPYASLWFGSSSKNFPLALIIGSRDKLAIGRAIIKSRLDSSKLSYEIMEKNNPGKFLNNFIMDKEKILAFTEGAPIHNDNYPLLEFLVPKGLLKRNEYGRENSIQLKLLHAKRTFPP